jgi:chromosomal replication initiator protein
MLHRINKTRGLRPVGWLDDRRSMHGRNIHGIPVLGSIDDIESIAVRDGIDEVVVSATYAGRIPRERFDQLERYGVPVRVFGDPTGASGEGKERPGPFAGMRIVYTTSERFMNQLIRCIRTDRMTLFHEYYRQADILLVDDIHILANKERTQEEFFHTFNELFEHQKQIVLSSDSPPKNTPGLVERLRSRFEWGLMVDVQPPDLETKMAILDRKADMEGIYLPEDVRIFIATKTRSNVRELEGALVKLIAFSSVTGTPIDINMARQALKHLSLGEERKISIEAIIRTVAERFSMQPSQIKQRSNTRRITYPRQIAMYIAKELTQASLPEIGRAFGGKHHTTVLHSTQKIEALRQKDPDLDRLIHSLIDSLN